MTKKFKRNPKLAVKNPPRKLSKLIDLGIKDVRGRPRRTALNMNLWFTKGSITHAKARCTACFAGCVMIAQGIPDYRMGLDPGDFSPIWRDAFCALDSARSGCVLDALEHLSVSLTPEKRSELDEALLKEFGEYGAPTWQGAYNTSAKIRKLLLGMQRLANVLKSQRL